MAEFKLGRIRFVWKGAWTASTTYYIDDVVRYGGRTYICAVGHASASDFNTDLEYVPTKWNQMSDGQEWKGNWTISTFYKLNDIVKYGGLLYLCKDSHTSTSNLALGLEADQDLPSQTNSKWELFAEGFDWKTDWTTSTRYKVNDLVRYGGYTYVCNEGHTSASSTASGLEADQSKWDDFNQGLEYKSAGWVSGTRYKKNDVVKEGAGLWICTTYHTAAGAFLTDQSAGRWSQFVKGFEFENDWNSATLYQPGDVVRYGGNQYVAKTVHTAAAATETPPTQASRWDLFAQGFRYQSDWANSTSYKIGDVVRLNGYTYLAASDSPSITTTVTGSNVSGLFTCSSTAGFVVGMTVKFTGTTFGNVFTGGTYYIKTVPVGGTTFTVSTTLGGSTFTPTSTSGSMTATVSAAPPNATYWAKLNSGVKWQGEWLDDTEYQLGDAVRYGSNAYICVQTHRSEADDASTVGSQGGGQSNSRPDRDSTGTYWNSLALGSETTALTTRGDMVYYGGAGPTRLPIGLEGQVLRSSGTDPEWVTLGKVDHVYYVAPQGTDGPAPIHGCTLDKPWASIRYACEQIEKGCRNPNAQRLLEMNRVFIQREVTEWIDRQVSTNTAPFTSAFDYDEYKCERDTGFLVDRLIWDIGHGGNLKMLAASLSYINALAGADLYATAADENGTGTYTKLSAEGTKDVAAYNYMLEVITAVLNNQAPATNYQVLNGDNSTSTVAQYIDTDYTAEAGVADTVTELVGIVTTALTDQAATNLPARLVPNNTINVKSGRYRETLPIIVPAETVVLGDEVRSTNAGPAGSLIDISDAYYSVTALGRLSTVIGQIVTGATVSKSTGNAYTQDQNWPYASSTEATLASSLVNVMKYQADSRLGTMHVSTLTDPTGYNVGYLTGYSDARKLIRENKKFLQEEVIAYLAANYPSSKYGKTKTRRDVGYIVDAAIYDLTYGGNAMSIQAGLAYFDAEGSTNLIPASIKALTLASISFLKTRMQSVSTSSAITPLQTTVPQYTDTAGSAGASTLIGSNVDIIYNLINGGNTTSAPNLTITLIAGTTTLTSTGHTLAVGNTVVPRTTANGLTAGTKYYVKTIATNTFTLAASFNGTAITSFSNGVISVIADIVSQPAATNAVTTTTALIAAYTALTAQIPTIGTGAIATVNAAYPTLSYSTAKTSRDVAIVLEAVGYDFMFNSNYRTVKAALAYLRANSVELYTTTNLKAATRAALSYAKTQAKANVGGDATAQARIETLMTLVDDIVFGAADEGDVCQTELRSRDWACLQLERNRDFIVEEARAYIASTFTGTVTASNTTTDIFTISSTSWLKRNAAIQFTGAVFGGVVSGRTYYVQNVVSATTFTIATTRDATTAFNLSTVASGSMTVSFVYNSDFCLRDVGTYIDAVKWDMKWSSNYKSRFVARYYANAVTGSYEEDMYYLRNGTGIRNQTLEGLNGDLTPENTYGTSRVTAGAYVSLDPGWGPDDFRGWITNRSPYVQNNACFGNAAIGQKIDGALHAGGNDSIVSNDFTQLISDGIGAWVTNNGRAELVSVFTYYSHVGYLSEAGGRIRGTNGNNSYGDFGSVAEGYDVTEVPGTGLVDNRNFRATVGQVITDGAQQVLNFEFDNAGSNYTEASWLISGAGTNAASQADEFRDGAVFQVRLLDNVDDSTSAPEADGNFGGFGYVSNANTAQGGTTTQITIAATDGELSFAYVGMKIVLTGGTGVGQYGIIATYNAGTKVATVNKESTGAAGWDHIIPGTVITAPDASTTYVVEPRISFTAPSYSSTAATLATSLTYTDVRYARLVKTYVGATGTTSGSGTGATFRVTRKGTKYQTVTSIATGTGYARLNTITIAGTSLDGLSTANDLVITITAVNSATGAIQAFEFAGTAAGGNYVAISSGTQTINTSTDGVTWTQRLLALPSASNWSAIATGKLTAEESAGSFVVGRSYTITTIGDTGWTAIGASSNAVGEVFVATGVGTGSGKATPNASHIVAVSTSTTVNAYSKDGGITWTAGGALPAGMSGRASAVWYGDGRWVAVSSGATATAYSTNGGISWTAGGALPTSTTWTGVAYGKGVWIAVASGGTNCAYSLDGGLNWSAGSGLTSSNWTAVTFGNNRFVAVSNTSGTAAAYSLDGIAWTATTVPSAQYTDVHYGQGVFLAVSQSTQAASSEDGIIWTSRTTSTAANGFSATAFGNPNQVGTWVAIQRSTASTVASTIKLGATARARSYVSLEKIYAIRITEPGSGYTVAPTMTITDPSNIYDAPFTVRIGNGALANPSFSNRGTGYTAAAADILTGDGYGDFYQDGQYVAVKRLTTFPTAGSNVVFGHLPNQTFKLVNVLTQLGSYPGSYSAFFQIAPNMKTFSTAEHEQTVTTRLRYSQVRLTGHDFLDIGTGSFAETNYPGGEPDNEPNQANETVDSNGGRCFYTSTDQDGNFRVGELFTIEQSTGVATLNADAFNIAGLQELTLGEVSLGGGSASITEFSTDPFFTANSDSIVPTQRAIKAYISSQIGGGGASLNVNSVTAGYIYIAGQEITTTTNGTIAMRANFNFQGGVIGLPVAWNYFLN